jgi:thiamine monophosphate synthase
MNNIEALKRSLQEKRCVKIISGIDNFDLEKVKKVLLAAEKGNANAVDVAAREDIVRLAKETTELPVFVSSINPEELKIAADCGADVLEIGNYDALYKKGLRITAEEILNITQKTIDLTEKQVMLSVTVPGHIDIAEQINLAIRLEELGVDLIQTEGAAIANVANAGARGLLETATVSIANTIEIARNVSIPVMTASGITVTTAPLAIAAGASAVGVGSCVNKLDSVIEMIATVKSIVESVNELKLSPEKVH